MRGVIVTAFLLFGGQIWGKETTDIGIGGKIILKWILKKYKMIWTGFILLTSDQLRALCVHVNESLSDQVCASQERLSSMEAVT
jgi:hypothetical protein